jgi:acetolactate synthase I/II/III large subunit
MQDGFLANVQRNSQLDIGFLKQSQQIAHVLLAKAVVKMLEDIEMQYAFGISIGAIA